MISARLKFNILSDDLDDFTTFSASLSKLGIITWWAGEDKVLIKLVKASRWIELSYLQTRYNNIFQSTQQWWKFHLAKVYFHLDRIQSGFQLNKLFISLQSWFLKQILQYFIFLIYIKCCHATSHHSPPNPSAAPSQFPEIYIASRKQPASHRLHKARNLPFF